MTLQGAETWTLRKEDNTKI